MAGARSGGGLLTALRVASASLRENPMRAALSTLGVIIGVAALVAVLALGDGMERFARTSIEGEGYQAVGVRPVTSDEVDGIAIPRNNVVTLTPQDAQELRSTLPGRPRVTLSARGVGTLTTSGTQRERGTNVVGLMDTDMSRAFALAHGRYLSEDEAASDAAVALVSAELAGQLTNGAALTNALNDTLHFATGSHVVVVGIVTAASGRAVNLVIAPPLRAQKLIAPGGSPSPAALEAHAATIEEVPAVKSAVEAWTVKRFGAGQKAVAVTALGSQRLEQLQKGVLLFKLFMGAVVGISLVVGGIGIMNVLLASVSERTREIGIRKTAGATNGEVMRQFLAESVVVTGAGALAGILLGLAGAFGFAAFMRSVSKAEIHAAFNILSLFIAVAAAVLVGLIFGIYPALRAAHLSPIEAIRHEG